MDFIITIILLQYMYIALKYMMIFPIFEKKILTQDQAKKFFIPIIGIWFIIKDWYTKLPKE